MNAEAEAETKAESPISERTQAILAEIQRVEHKVDQLLEHRNRWTSAVTRALKQFISLLP